MTNVKSNFRMLASLFFIWGFITVSNDLLISRFKHIFNFSSQQGALVQVAFFIAFFFVSLLFFISSIVLKQSPLNKIGYKNGMMISLFVCATGCFLFYPSALAQSYYGFLSSLFILASGVTLLQICANPYAAILGDKSSATSRLNLAQGLNSLGTTIGPIIGGLLIFQLFNTDSSLISIAKTYLIYGGVFTVLGLVVFRSNLPEFKSEDQLDSPLSVLKNKKLVLGILAIFCYVGAEVSIGSWIIPFISSKNIGNLEESRAAYFLSYFWGGLMIGRLMAATALNNDLDISQKRSRMIFIALGVFTLIYLVTSLNWTSNGLELEFVPFKWISLYLIFILTAFLAFNFSFNKAAKSLSLFTIINISLIIIAMFSSGQIAFWSIIGTGLFFSVGWSNIFSLAIEDLGNQSSVGSSLLVMAIVGGAFLPYLQSIIIDKYSIQTSFIIPALALTYILIYGVLIHTKRLK